MDKKMIFNLVVVALIFGAGGVFGQLLPATWESGYTNLLAVTADIATICAAGAALYALTQWRQQLRSQKAYEALSVLLNAFRDRDLVGSYLSSLKAPEADKWKRAWEVQLVQRDVRRCVNELSVLGYEERGARLAEAASHLFKEFADFRPDGVSPALNAMYALGSATDRFTAEIYSLQKEVFKSGVL